MNQIVMKDIQKSINEIKVLDSVNLSIEQGEICALIGPNGAGKTTLINCLLNLIIQEQGIVKINDKIFTEATRNEILMKIGAVLQYPTSISHLSIKQLFEEHFHYLKLENHKSYEEILNSVELDISINTIIGKLSLGMKQRLLLGVAISHNPSILILDEPFNGLDPDGVFLIKDIMKKIKNNNGIVLISSHSLSELEDFCTSIAFIKNGHIYEKNYIETIMKDFSGGLSEYYKKFKKRGGINE